ncbi:VOC family protein [Erythrobacter alti]|uniref:VOC family protein n=1 Tax=Erythrobacter alti TaxID=1896145 RepID=UPI0030F46339
MDDIATCLWFEKEGEEAARYYCGVFPDSGINAVHKAPMDWPGGSVGDTILVEFTLRGRSMTALNGGAGSPHTMAVSLQVFTETQEETDRYWSALLADGGEEMACSWLKDRWGVHWQIVPRVMMEGLRHEDEQVRLRTNMAMMQMVKIDHAGIEAAITGGD